MRRLNIYLPLSFFVLLFAILMVNGCSFPYINTYHDPLTPEEHFRMAMAYEKEGEHAAALREYSAASEGIPQAFYYMGNIYFEQEKYDKAEENYEAALEETPLHPQSLNNLAWLYYVQRRNLEKAESLSLKALEVASDEESEAYRDTLNRIRTLKEGAPAPKDPLH